MAADDWPFRADKSSTIEGTSTELSVQFDEGAEQIAPRGLTAPPIIFNVKFIIDNDTDLNTGWNFLVAKNGQPFLWTAGRAPFAAQQNWRCSEWSLFYEGGTVAGIQGKFKIYYPT